MNNDINLILGKRKEAYSKASQLARVKIAAGISLGIVVLMSILLFIINQSSGIELLLKKEKDDTAIISSRQKIIGKLLLLQNRLDDIQNISTNRPSPDIYIQQIIQGMPQDIHIDSFSLTKKKISITLTSSSLISLDKFTNYLLNKVNNKDLFNTFTMNSIIADPGNQRYILSFDADLL